MTMNKCKPIRSNDEMQCTCGITWGINEEKPECRLIDWDASSAKASPGFGQYHIDKIKEDLNNGN